MNAKVVQAFNFDESGATVKLRIVAANAVGDAPASEVVQLQAAWDGSTTAKHGFTQIDDKPAHR